MHTRELESPDDIHSVWEERIKSLAWKKQDFFWKGTTYASSTGEILGPEIG